ncbi:MAG: serine/threonine-protein kinase [Planctomycetota bacterium]
MRPIERIKSAFNRIGELRGTERDAALEELRAVDAALYQEVFELLESEAKPGGVLDAPLFQSERRGGPLEIGDRLGPYVIDEFIACGGGGAVYRAHRDEAPGEAVALKVLVSSEVSERDRQRFRKESRIVRGVDHPNLIAVREDGEDEERGLLYYAMPFVEGPNLAELLEHWSNRGHRPGFEERRAIVRWVIEVADALRQLHAQGLVHRDVKPANIVLEGGSLEDPFQGYRPVLVDLGLVRSAGDCVSTVRVSPPYASPEQWIGPDLDVRTDVFSLGLTLHDLLVGRPPSERLPAGSQWLQRTEALSGELRMTEPDLMRIVLLATEPSRRARYGAIARLAGDLQAWLDGRSIMACRYRALRDLRRWARREPRTAAWAGVKAFGVLALLSAVVLGALEVARQKQIVQGAWWTGDLATLQAAALEISLPTELLCEREVRNGLSRIRSGDPADPVVEVLDLLHRDGEAPAFRRAAIHVEARGVLEQPVLTRFLGHAWSRNNSRASYTGLLSRLAFDRPNRSAAEDEATRAWVSTAWEVIESTGDERALCEAVGMLRGIGRPEDVPDLLHWIRGAAARRTEVHWPPVQAGFRALRGLLNRSLIAGTAKAFSEHETYLLIDELGALFDSLEGEQRIARSSSIGPVLGRIVAIQRQLGFQLPPASRFPVLRSVEQSRLLSLLKDPDHWVRLEGGPHIPEALLEREPTEISRRIAGILHEYGMDIAMYGDPELERIGKARAVEAGKHGALSVQSSVAVFEEGLLHGQESLAGTYPDNSADPGTHLGDELIVTWTDPPLDAELLEWPEGGEAVRGFLAGWDFTFPQCRVRQGTVRWANGKIFIDELSAGETRHLRLQNPGVSRLELEVLLPELKYNGCLHVDAQKSRRWTLYRDGIAKLEISQGGNEPATFPLVEREEYTHRLFSGPKVSRVSVGLSPDSTTTARIYRVWIHFSPSELNWTCRRWGTVQE